MPDPDFKQELADAAQRAAQLSAELDQLSFRIAALEQRQAEAEAAKETETEVPWAEPSEVVEAPSPPIPDPVGEPPSPPEVTPPTVPAMAPPPPAPTFKELSTSEQRECIEDMISSSGLPRLGEAGRHRESSAGSTELVIGRIWLNRIGAVILFLAAAFFVQYSAAQGWIGPTLRVSLAVLAGIALIIGGEFMLHRDMRPVAGGLVGCGVAILYVAAFATYNLYHLVSSEFAFGLYFAVSVLSVALSVHSRMLPIAVLGLIGGYGTPVLISTGTNQQIALLTYVMVLNVGFLVIASYRRWDILRGLSWIGTVFLFGGWYVTYYDTSALWTTWAFLAGFYVLFHGSSLLTLRLRSFNRMSDLTALVSLNNIAFFGCTYFLWRRDYSDWLGLFAVVLGGLQWIAAWRVAPTSEETARGRLPFWIGGAAMLSLAAPLQFDRYMVSVSWCVQAVATFAFCRRFADPWLRLKATGLLLAAAVHLLVFERHDAALTVELFSLGLWTVSSLTLLLALAGVSAYGSATALVAVRDADEQDRTLAAGLAICGTAWLMWMFAYEWERYLASWWWLGLAVCWWLVSMRVAKARYVAISITLALCVKFLAWDTLVAAKGFWSGLNGIILNRAVVTGALVAGLAGASGKLFDHFGAQSENDKSGGSDERKLLTGFCVLIITCVGTFEIYRAFRFEPWVTGRFETPAYAVGIFVTIFWAFNAAAMWILARPLRPVVTAYAVLLNLAVAIKLLVVDTAAYAFSGRWEGLSGICTNRTFLGGLVVVAATFYGGLRLRRLVREKTLLKLPPAMIEGWTVLTVVLAVWLPSFEIIRVFNVEPLRLRFDDPELAMHVLLSVTWSVMASGCLALGFARRIAVLRYAALSLYLITIIKVFVFDLSRLDTIYRIVSFLVLGVMLLGASVLYQKLSSRVEIQQ